MRVELRRFGNIPKLYRFSDLKTEGIKWIALVIDTIGDICDRCDRFLSKGGSFSLKLDYKFPSSICFELHDNTNYLLHWTIRCQLPAFHSGQVQFLLLFPLQANPSWLSQLFQESGYRLDQSTLSGTSISGPSECSLLSCLTIMRRIVAACRIQLILHYIST